jgi:hypothetical protein
MTGRFVAPLAGLPIEIAGRRVTTDATGSFSLAGTFSGPVHLKLIYEAPVTSSGVTTNLQIMNDIKNTRTEERDVATTSVGVLSSAGVVEISSLDCELFRIGRQLLNDYHGVRFASPPAGKLRLQRWNEIRVATHTYYDYINVSPDWQDLANTPAWRESTLFHEFGHSIRHVADGTQSHWEWDNFRWAYARSHDGDEIFNTQYAFNEGWADYWERARPAAKAAYVTPHPAGFLHWNEHQIGNRLFDLARAADVGDRVMLEVLESNPGTIHSLFDFESRLAARLHRPAPAAPPSCPPGYHDDGATCRSGGEVIPKSSYGRGAGTAPSDCGAGNENWGGLCYPACREGFRGVGTMCWEFCPPGYTDDGLTCRRDASIVTSDNSRCNDWDKCGLTFDRGCSVCPAGYQNDGCFCRVDADIFGKSGYDRGVGRLPSICPAGQEMSGLLCYPTCSAGFAGSGPVCWGSCPTGFVDDGALCRRPLSILVKY